MSAKKDLKIITILKATMLIGYRHHFTFLSIGLGEISSTQTCFLTASVDKFSDSIQKGPRINWFGDIPVTPGFSSFLLIPFHRIEGHSYDRYIV